jgi:hypothetical protein
MTKLAVDSFLLALPCALRKHQYFKYGQQMNNARNTETSGGAMPKPTLTTV